MRSLIVGPGKMGKAVEAALVARGHEVVGRLGRADLEANALEGFDTKKLDMAFEFTTPEAAASV